MKQYNSLRVLLVVAVTALIFSTIWSTTTAQAATGTTRIRFDKGATSGVVSGNLQANGSARYVLYAGYGQLMDVILTANEGVKLKVTTTGGKALTPISGTGGSTSFRGYLPYSGDYYIVVTAGSQAVSYSVNVFIPVRIRFAVGATSKTLTAHLNAHQGLDYIAWAAKEQILEVNATPSSAGASLQLVIFGVDGTMLRSGMGEGSSFVGELPLSGDYIISVRAGETATDFTLQVIIPQRIRFASGAYSGSVNTYLPAGLTQYYSLDAGKDQTMEVAISPKGGLKLAIEGIDGTVLKSASSGGASFSGTLPSTQDYFLTVTNTGNSISYWMTVTIK
jgi:hypothetical protein